MGCPHWIMRSPRTKGSVVAKWMSPRLCPLASFSCPFSLWNDKKISLLFSVNSATAFMCPSPQEDSISLPYWAQEVPQNLLWIMNRSIVCVPQAEPFRACLWLATSNFPSASTTEMIQMKRLLSQPGSWSGEAMKKNPRQPVMERYSAWESLESHLRREGSLVTAAWSSISCLIPYRNICTTGEKTALKAAEKLQVYLLQHNLAYPDG